MKLVGEKNFYKILGVTETASKEDIKKSYRKLAKKYHPDSNRDNPHIAERFKEISEAYSVLSDPEKKKQYDAVRAWGGGGYRDFAQYQPPDGMGGGTPFGDLGDISEMFRSFFSFDDHGTRRKKPEQGKDIHLEIEIPFEQALKGGKRSIAVPVEDVCRTCKGSGSKPGSKVQKCSHCGGRGSVSFNQGAFAVKKPCSYCYGRGTVIATPCPDCRGSGITNRVKKIAVEIPKGVAGGTTVRVKGQGRKSSKGGYPGDIYITCRVGEHPFFQRNGLNVQTEVPINIAQAAFGTKVQVKTVHGKTVQLNLPAGTNSGKRMKLKGQGLTKDEKTGDHIIVVQVLTPQISDAKQKELLETFAREKGFSW